MSKCLRTYKTREIYGQGGRGDPAIRRGMLRSRPEAVIDFPAPSWCLVVSCSMNVTVMRC